MVKSNLKRGFKANAERQALEYREKMNLQPWSRLCAFKFAEYLNIPIYNIFEFIPNPENIETFNKEVSAFKLLTRQGNTIIVYNPNHSSKRQQSDVIHEICHIICDHKEKIYELNYILPRGLRYLDPVQEEEANCLGYTILLPKPCLFWALKRNMSLADISEHFQVSIEATRLRLNMTGLSRRLSINKDNE